VVNHDFYCMLVESNTIVDRILQAYNRSHDLPPIDNAYIWFEKYNMKSFMEDIHKIEGKLQVLS